MEQHSRIMKSGFKLYLLILFLLALEVSVFLQGKEYKNLSRKWIHIGHKKLLVEIADKAITRKQGLMFRKVLRENEGMLFIFQQKKQLVFWMKNTSIPLNIGFFDEEKKFIESKEMFPYSLKKTRSSKKAQYALEMSRGWFKKNQIKRGDRLIFLNKK